MTFDEFMEAAGYRVYHDEILGGTGFMWNAGNGEPRAAVFDPTPPPEIWWTVAARLRDDPRPDTPLDFYRLERFR